MVVVLFLFLFNYRTAFICTTAIPTSLLSAVIVLDYFGVGLNIMVLGGLAIALGEVVDDAIIDTENIFRRLRENRALPRPRPAAEVVLDASVEVRSSVVYATFIVALVFVPLLTLGGVAGKLFAPLGLAYILAILASLVVALTLTPALCYLLLARSALKSADPPAVAWLKPRYRRLLERIERYPGRVVSAVFVVIAGGIGLLPLFSGEFIPALREGHYIIHMTAVPGTAESESLRIGQRVAKAIGSIKGVQSVAQWVGRAPNGADTFGTHYSEFEVEIGALRGKEQARILREIRETLSGERGGAVSRRDLRREHVPDRAHRGDHHRLRRAAGDQPVRHRSRSARPRCAGGGGGASPACPARATCRCRRRRVRRSSPSGCVRSALAALGLAPLAVLEAIQAAYDGAHVGAGVPGQPRGRPGGRARRRERATRWRRSGSLQLRAADGRLVPLREVADIELDGGRYKILHSGGRRMQTVTANVDGRDLRRLRDRGAQRASPKQVKPRPGQLPGVTPAPARAQAQAREDLIVHSVIAGIGIFLLLYIAFNNLRNLRDHVSQPAVRADRRRLRGAVATGGWLSLGSLVGFVTLFGITLRNSIMLVSHYQHLVEVEGLPWNAETALRGRGGAPALDPDDRAGHGARVAAAGARHRRAGARDRRSDGDDHRRRAGHVDPAESAGPADDPAALRPVRDTGQVRDTGRHRVKRGECASARRARHGLQHAGPQPARV